MLTAYVRVARSSSEWCEVADQVAYGARGAGSYVYRPRGASAGRVRAGASISDEGSWRGGHAASMLGLLAWSRCVTFGMLRMRLCGETGERCVVLCLWSHVSTVVRRATRPRLVSCFAFTMLGMCEVLVTC